MKLTTDMKIPLTDTDTLLSQGIESIRRTSTGPHIYYNEKTGNLSSQLSDFTIDTFAHLNDYLNYRFLASPLTLLKGIQKIPLETELSLKDLSTHKIPSEKTRTIDWNKLENKIREEVEKEERIGVFLSGGIDSSLIFRLVCDYNEAYRGTNKNITAFTLDDSFTGGEDIKHAKLLTDTSDVNKVIMAYDKEYGEFYTDQLLSLQEPSCDPSIIGVNKIIKEAEKRGIQVLFSGEGADEIFLGYGRYKQLHKMKSIDVISQTITQFPQLQDDKIQNELEGTKNYFSYLIQKDRSVGMADYVLRKFNTQSAKIVFPYVELLNYAPVDFERYVKKQLKEYAINKLPNKILNRKKSTLKSPIEIWAGNKDFKEQFYAKLASDKVQLPVEIKQEDIQQLFSNIHKENARKIWSLYSLMTWQAEKK